MRAAWWWIDRWRADPARSDLSYEAKGVYRELRDELWLRDGILPSDDSVLARIVGDREVWERCRVAVLACFVLTERGYSHPEHDEVYGESLRRARKQAAYRERESRNQGVTGSVTTSVTTSVTGSVTGSVTPCVTRSPSPSPSLSREQEPTQKMEPSAPVVSPPASEPSGLFGPDGPGDESRPKPQKPKADQNGQAEALVAAFHATLPGLPKVRVPLASGIRKAVTAALRRDPLGVWAERFTRVASCPFLMGEKTDWKANLVWILGPENSAKIDAGQYDRHEAPVENLSDYNRRSLEQAKRIRLPWETEDVAPWDGEALPNQNEKPPLRIAATPTTDEEAATAAKVNGLVRGLLNGHR